MKATFKQLEFIDKVEERFCITYLGEYGFHSNGSVGVLCQDDYGVFSNTVDQDGNVI